MQNCTDCDSYQRGKGRPACLQCQKYKDILLSTTKRQTIRIDVIPDTILNDIPDNRAVTLLDALKQLPLELSVPVIMRHILDASLREIADYHGYSRTSGTAKIKNAIEIIKKMTVFDEKS